MLCQNCYTLYTTPKQCNHHQYAIPHKTFTLHKSQLIKARIASTPERCQEMLSLKKKSFANSMQFLFKTTFSGKINGSYETF